MTALREVLSSLHREQREPGGAVCVATPDGGVIEESVGDRGDGTPWTSDTLVMGYSCAKPLAALAVLSAVADGALRLDQPVAEVWPEYGTGGKETTTVRHLLSHQAGLPAFPEAAAEVEYDDRQALVALLAGAAPVHPPGAAVAEHALTYGHLCDELLLRVVGVGVAERFAGLARKHHWDLHLVVPDAELGRVADVVPVDSSWPDLYLADPAWGPALGRPLGLLDPTVLNSTRWRRASFAAISLHGSARGLALFYADLVPVDGPVAERLGAGLHRELLAVQARGPDLVIGREVSWTLGCQLDRLPDGRWEIGMGGAGGCAGWASVAADGRLDRAVGYVTRGLGDHARGDLIERAVAAVG